MRIGIDLDNTIINYDEAFKLATKEINLSLPDTVRTKSEIRDFIRYELKDELLWQRLQGLTYGRCLHKGGKLFPCVKRFLWRCKRLGHTVIIVSHKTEYGHFDSEKISLRQAARNFLHSKGLLNDNNALVSNIFFESTRQEKVNRIQTLNFDVFIDDLVEIIENFSQSSFIRKILFVPNQSISIEQEVALSRKEITIANDWQSIDFLINGTWTLEDTEAIAKMILASIGKVESIKEGGNAGVYKIQISSLEYAKIKIYPCDSTHDRLHSEFEGLKALQKCHISNIPKPIYKDKEMRIAAYSWIDGHIIKQHNQFHIRVCLEFLDRIHKVRNSQEFETFSPASAACFSGADILYQLECRLIQFDACRVKYHALNYFLENDFIPVTQQLISWSQENWNDSIDFNSPLPRKRQTISPSDFGFHNMIQFKDNCFFVDFEYLGWDDPTKLISDFFFHPGMKLSREQKELWISGTLNIYGHDLQSRLRASLPLFGLIWCLILLNDYRDSIWQRRLLADCSRQGRRTEILDDQLNLAKSLLKIIKLNYRNFLSEV